MVLSSVLVNSYLTLCIVTRVLRGRKTTTVTVGNRYFPPSISSELVSELVGSKYTKGVVWFDHG